MREELNLLLRYSKRGSFGSLLPFHRFYLHAHGFGGKAREGEAKKDTPLLVRLRR